MKKSLLLILAMAIGQFIFAQDCSQLFISEYVEGSGNNKAIEIYNPTDNTIDLTPYSLVRYSNGGTTPNAVNLGGGFIEPYGTYVVVLDKRDPNGTGYEEPVDSALAMKADTFLCPVYEVNKMMYFNGNDAVTLENDNGDVLDIVARVGSPDPENGWTDITDTTITWMNAGVPEDYTIVDYAVGPLFWLSWTKDNTLIRKAAVKHGVIDNPSAFNVALEWDSIPKNSFENLGTHVCDCHESGISDNAQLIKIDFYPNPVTDGVMTIKAEEKIASVELINTLGNSIMKENYTGQMQLNLSLDKYSEGI